MEALENILTRKSVRSFTMEKISEEEITTLLKAGMSAPSAINKQPWSFYVVTSEDKLSAMRKAMPFGKYECPLIIVPCVKENACIPFGGHDLAYCDLGAATENILLAAHALGLGAVWCAAYPNKKRIAAIQEAIGIKKGETPFSTIYIGHPSDKDKSAIKDKYREDRIRRV